MKLSHSKLQQILTCPMSYYLNYKQGIKLKRKKDALTIGSAVHYGIEHDTEDLTNYFKENGSFEQKTNYSREQILAESMVHGYLLQKDKLFEEILKDDQDNKLNLINETHELEIMADLKNFQNGESNEFIGIIDLLLLTDKGFIVIDYKTSSQVPDWNKYLDQIYRYIFLLKHNFPSVPVYKIGIINLRKSSIRQKQNENLEEFINRFKREYESHSDLYLQLHIYEAENLDLNLIEEYNNNLRKEAEMANIIENNKLWYINWNNIEGQYGKSDYYDIFYKTPGNYLLYKITDEIYDKENNIMLNERDCVDIDMEVIDRKDVLNKFKIYEEEVGIFEKKSKNENLNQFLKSKYKCNDDLLNLYKDTYNYKKLKNN